mmetsp:Transcript_73722/g.170952  ORF Transcript_73722/g.170952 Transcript_73722/m.170952 type:complete len:200 (-) Transcript_73722:265-864(-)
MASGTSSDSTSSNLQRCRALVSCGTRSNTVRAILPLSDAKYMSGVSFTSASPSFSVSVGITLMLLQSSSKSSIACSICALALRGTPMSDEPLSSKAEQLPEHSMETDSSYLCITASVTFTDQVALPTIGTFAKSSGISFALTSFHMTTPSEPGFDPKQMEKREQLKARSIGAPTVICFATSIAVLASSTMVRGASSPSS